mgnify:FL=1
MRSFIIAEAGVNHNGSEVLALSLVKEAYLAGADAVKFQTFSAESLVSKGTKTAEYQSQSTGENDQFTMLKKLELSFDLHINLIKYCNELGIEFMSTPFDEKAAEFLLNLGMKRIKIASGELTNLPFIRKLAAFHVPIILSTGMGSMKEVMDAVYVIKDEFKKNKSSLPFDQMLTLLHCTSNYPTKFKDVNLKAMQTMTSEFSIPSGYSDHTKGIFVPILAVSMGATILEKHLTLDKNMPGPDQNTSLNPVEFKDMVNQIRDAEVCIGDGVKAPRESELPIRDLVRRSVVLKTNKLAGDVIALEDLILLRPGGGISPADMINVVGKKFLYDCDSGTTLYWEDLSL